MLRIEIKYVIFFRYFLASIAEIHIGRSPACAGRSNGRGFMWHVYIIKSSVKRWYYVGSTNRIEVRLKEHNTGKVLSTKAFKPFCLIFQKGFEFEKEARAYEKLLKTKRTEKEKIIRLFENKNN